MDENAKTWTDFAAAACSVDGSRIISPESLTAKTVAENVMDRGTEADSSARSAVWRSAGRSVRYCGFKPMR